MDVLYFLPADLHDAENGACNIHETSAHAQAKAPWELCF